jgi:hypothetical protein
MWFALLSVAAADTWHPADVAALSRQFDRLAARQSAVFEERNRAAAGLSAALRDYRTALDTLGERAPVAERAALEDLEESYNAQFARLQAFADRAVGESEAAFQEALARALPRLGLTDPPCAKERPVGNMRLPGMPVRMEANPDCTGADRNADVSAAMDADPVLGAFVDAALAADWPGLALTALEPVPVVGSGTRWVGVTPFTRATAGRALMRVEEQDDLERSKAGLDLATPEEATALLDTARAIAARTAAARAGVADPLLRAAEKVAARWEKEGEPATAWCARPAALGGCLGEDATSALLKRLLADRRIGRIDEAP